jgi:hypothetical protein
MQGGWKQLGLDSDLKAWAERSERGIGDESLHRRLERI